MLGFGEALTIANIKTKVSSKEIFRRYCTNFKDLNSLFKSEFREDKNPSCCVIMYKDDLLYKDFGSGVSTDAVGYVMMKFNTNFHGALEIINQDFNLGLGEYTDGSKNLFSQITKYPEQEIDIPVRKKVLKVKVRDWKICDVDYWKGKYEISKRTLDLFKVRPISHFWIDELLVTADQLAYDYAFYWEDGIFRRKIYQPVNTKVKWISNGGAVVQGEGVLPKQGNLLIITKSLKDVMALYEMGYTAIAPTSETSFLPGVYLEKQQSRFIRIVIFFDNDKQGKISAVKWNLLYVFIPEEFKVKDISDMICTYRMKFAKEFMKDLLTKLNL
jgi:hypothetical protein